MVKFAGREITDIQLVLFGLVLVLGGGYLAIWQLTPGPALPGPQGTVYRADVLLTDATVTSADEGNFQFSNSQIAPSGRLFGTFDEPGTDINPGETVDYCADVTFQSDADYTYVGTFLSSADFDFPQEGDVKWSDYYRSGTTVEICMPFEAPGGGTYSQTMWCDFNSPGCEDKVDEDTFEVVGETDSPPEIQSMDCPSSVTVDEDVTVTADVQDDSGISDYNWDITGFTGDGAEDDSVTVQFDTTGTKTFELTVVDQSGQTDTDSCSVNVDEQTQQDPSTSISVNLLDQAAAALANIFR